ncbi:hypothetical protein [Egicoccus halophilus]|uniref:Uncharacterized protein n=1 Tax=Egicoccus halophilus TaxID=1670830 RepID=A0A8J3A7H2_9ACTN|nr:hypothetical protein [Egicoccus halophilus]GGI05450.1 hypothetical protein GCM10011354_14160 [Egicoccus halophilus]
MEGAYDRTALWLPLLRELTERHPGWAIWKNVDSAFAGTGDVDSLGPPEDWDAIRAVFEAWAARNGLGPVIVCRHIPQGPHYLALDPDSPFLVQLDVKQCGTWRGSTLVDDRDLQALSERDERGFRRVRPGAEGVIKLLMNGTRRGGGANEEGLRTKRVAELLAADPAGATAATRLVGPARRPLQRGIDAVVAGRWDLAAMRRVEAWCLARSLLEPRTALSRLWFLYHLAPRCPVVTLIRDHDRIVPEDRDGWLAEVARDHEVVTTPGGRDPRRAPYG